MTTDFLQPLLKKLGNFMLFNWEIFIISSLTSPCYKGKLVWQMENRKEQ